MRNH
jgi:hypothetical protein